MLRTRVFRSLCLLSSLLSCALVTSIAMGYPLDGYEYTGIGRLGAARLVAIGERSGKQPLPGELLPLDMVELRLTAYPELTLPQPDPAFTAKIKALLGDNQRVD